MQAYQIILLIAIILAFLYLVLVVYVMGEVREFKLHLRRRIQGLNLLLSQRAKSIGKIRAVFQRQSIAIPEEDDACFSKVKELRFDAPSEESVKSNVSLIKEATSRLRAIAESNPEVEQLESFQFELGLLMDLERNYRALVGQYNADVIAYNYWIKIPTLRWLCKLLRNRERLLLN